MKAARCRDFVWNIYFKNICTDSGLTFRKDTAWKHHTVHNKGITIQLKAMIEIILLLLL